MIAAPLALPSDFSFQGTLNGDDGIQLFTFSVSSPSTVTIQTLSYAGGINAQGVTIPNGGFDPVLTLFDSSGVLADQNDDGGSFVLIDPSSGRSSDAYLQSAFDLEHTLSL